LVRIKGSRGAAEARARAILSPTAKVGLGPTLFTLRARDTRPKPRPFGTGQKRG